MRRTLFSRISTGALISIEGNVALWLWVPHMESGLSLQATSCGLHQGIFSQPGRVVTLVGSENPEEPVWGIAYNIAKEDVDRVVAHLDHREKDGYQKIPVTFHPQDSSIQPWQLIIYLESRVQVVLLVCKEDMISPSFLIESADLKMVDSRWSQTMVGSNAISFLDSLVSVNNIQLHFESKRLPDLLSNARRH
ncbi:uncharacterized protein LOC123505634 isoform X2 [Portunus trituberculatus]|uniref:uncharacterized protein LOC123505634 isoform X2 n=1 Tax=Portunus trituberculatus TaxID=210409 RepID=UPI001E1CDF30|nr:uncharacterized protein LOC123505634 isoform X2 [Portunus trituberculatus]